MRHTRTAPAAPSGETGSSLVVGIGASAGGLDALEKLFSLMPAESGVAFVVVQHLDRRHPSLLAELLGRRTRMPVTQATDGVRPERDHVYVIAPNTILTIERGTLRVRQAPEGTSQARIDAFLRSLADDRAEAAVGVLLSGAGSDGTAGLRAIKEHGGVALVQDPRSAKHGSMPRTAIEAGLADEVLAIEQIPAALVAHARHLATTWRASAATLDADLRGSLRAVCAVLQQRTGHDFSRYKEATLLRRIRRHVHVRHAATAAEYLRTLEQDPGEPQRLLKDLLIGVTQFFRDPDTFERVAGLLPRILDGKADDVPVRIWVPGCSSGEEAYSIAMVVHEQLARTPVRRLVQIFATDIEAETVAEARAGRYPSEIEEHVSPERLARHFIREGTGWSVGKELREMCIFSVHSLIRDPPFSALDLISCRNVLIYLEPDLQKKVVPLFHYALRHGGYLLLGSAEGVVNHSDLFETVDKKHRIFRRKETVSRPHVDFPVTPRSAPRTFELPPAIPRPEQRATAAIERLLLDEYAPACAVVDERGDVRFVAGRIGRFLAPPAGAPTTNLLDAVRDSLRVEIRMALHSVASSGARVVRENVPVELEDGVRRVRVTVRPVPGTDGLFAVIVQERALEEVEGLEASGAPLVPPALEQIEVELRSTRADLRAAVEGAEAANEELRSANEELISTNEELQSANEELQTSKEELQSLNEELETVNAELHRNVDGLAGANADLRNLFASTDIATIFLDRDLRIARFTPAATGLFRLIDTDVGRPIADFTPRFDGQELVALAREVLRNANPVERQVRGSDGAWFILRLLPYRTLEDVVAGVVATFFDVSELKRAEAALRDSEERFRLVVEGARDHAILMLAPDGTVATWNSGAERLKGYGAEEIVGQSFERFFTDEDRRARRPQRVLEAAAAHGRFEEEAWRQRKDGTRFWANVVITALRDEAGRLRGFAKITRDFTERKETEARLTYLASFPGKNPSPIVEADVDGHVTYANAAALRLFPDIHARGSGHPFLSPWDAVARSVRETSGGPGARVVTVGERSFYQVIVQPPEERVVRLYAFDITERVRAEGALRESEQRYAAIYDHAPFAIGLTRMSDGVVVSVNDAFATLFGYTREELLGRTSVELRISDPGSRERVAAELRRRGVVRELEVSRTTRSGDLRVLSLNVDPVTIAGERLHLTTIQDITDRKRVEDALTRSRQGLGRLADASRSVVEETDRHGMLQAISEAALALTGARNATCGHGYVAGQFLVGGSARAPGAPACPPGDMFVVQKGGVHIELADGADAIRLTDGELRSHPRWWGLSADHVPLRGLLGVKMRERSGLTSGLILVTDKADGGDFTEEDESLLQQLATIASLALQHVDARISLEEADRSKNQFLAMLSHELRNPLAPIRNSVYVLEHAAPGGEQARRAQSVIDRQVVHLTRLVDDLLDVTRISRGKIQVRLERLDLCDTIRRAAEDHRSLFAQAGLVLRVAVPERPLWIDGDRTRISQIVGNLLHNAVKFSERGGEVAVAAEANDALRQAIVRIRDTGVGIAADVLPRLFSPFAQADTTLDRSKGGLGLGLALVRGLVELHGGTVSVESEGPGRGAEFTVRLPLATAEAPTASAAQRPSAGRARRILLIEDNVDAAQSLREVLELCGHDVAVAFTGPEGIDKARTFAPEVVLCDIGLPGMDGYDVARRMRAAPELRGTKLVALTGYAAPEDVARSREAGFGAHMAKPLSVEKLEELLADRDR